MLAGILALTRSPICLVVVSLFHSRASPLRLRMAAFGTATVSLSAWIMRTFPDRASILPSTAFCPASASLSATLTCLPTLAVMISSKEARGVMFLVSTSVLTTSSMLVPGDAVIQNVPSDAEGSPWIMVSGPVRGACRTVTA